MESGEGDGQALSSLRGGGGLKWVAPVGGCFLGEVVGAGGPGAGLIFPSKVYSKSLAGTLAAAR